MKRRFVAIVSILGAGAGLLACSSSTESVATTDQSLEVFNWWTNPGETDALQALLNLYKTSHPQTSVINAAVENISKAQEQIYSRMTTGSPPDTFQVIGGWNLWQWVAYNGQDDSQSKMEPIDSVAAANNLEAAVPKPIRDAVSYNGTTYSIPIGIHRTNNLFFNAKLFRDNNLTPPTTLPEFYQVGDALKALGIEKPFALGSKDGFFVSLLAFDVLLIAKTDVRFREAFFSGTADPNEAANAAKLTDVLTELAKMLDYVNVDHDSVNWDGAAQKVVDGTAAMTIVGDWAKGFFLSQAPTHPSFELGEIPAPGTAGVFVHLVDSFGLPKGVQDRQATVNFLNMIASAEAQDTFNPIKGATPPRTDADKLKYDSFAQQTIDDYRSSTLTGTMQVLIKSPAFFIDMGTAMKAFANDGIQDNVLNVLKNGYSRLK